MLNVYCRQRQRQKKTAGLKSCGRVLPPPVVGVWNCHVSLIYSLSCVLLSLGQNCERHTEKNACNGPMKLNQCMDVTLKPVTLEIYFPVVVCVLKLINVWN